jgi:biofilm protein TabA
MKNYKCVLVFAFSVLLFVACRGPRVSKDGTWTKKAATKWVAQNSWRHGFTTNLAEGTDAVAFTTQYNMNPALWDKAFAFLNNTNLDTLSPGKYPIQGDDLFASVTISPTKEFDKTNWESHKKYIDLQYVISGKEKIGVAPLSSATVTKPYDEAKDVANYSADGIFHLAEPTVFFLFFPTDVHRPNVKVEGIDSDKKIVLKIRVAQ